VITRLFASGGGSGRQRPAHGGQRAGTGGLAGLGSGLRDAWSASLAYLPVILMGLLALGTYWLVRSTPVPEPDREAGPPSGEPDYVMQRFSVQRYGADGALRAQIAGDRLRHYPDTDTLLIDQPRVRTLDEQGRITQAQAERAQSNGDGGELLLEGAARVLREAHGDEPATEVVGAELRASRASGRIESRKPVTVNRAGSVLRADAVVFDHANRVITLTGRVRATLLPTASTGTVAPTSTAPTPAAPS
jgi:lipopolysaccharide export system protein LptC